MDVRYLGCTYTAATGQSTRERATCGCDVVFSLTDAHEEISPWTHVTLPRHVCTGLYKLIRSYACVVQSSTAVLVCAGVELCCCIPKQSGFRSGVRTPPLNAPDHVDVRTYVVRTYMRGTHWSRYASVLPSWLESATPLVHM